MSRQVVPPLSPLYRRWQLEMRRLAFFRAADRVGVAVSGGPDSILLLDFMRQLARERGLLLAIVHFNHRLRGSESQADEEFVKEVAHEAGIEFIRDEAEVACIARQRKGNLEATARELRYRFFFSLIGDGRMQKIATAHTANDQAETVLLRLLRGTGTRGLGGVRPVLKGGIVRPFLNLTRTEVMSEIQRRTLKYRVDSSNADLHLARTRVRRHLLPWLCEELNPHAVRLLAALAERSRDDEDYLEQQAGHYLRSWPTSSASEEKVRLSILVNLHPALQRRVLRGIIANACGSANRLTQGHLEALRAFVSDAQSGKRLILPGLSVWREFDQLVFKAQQGVYRQKRFSYPVAVPGKIVVPEIGWAFDLKIVTADGLRTAYNSCAVRGTLPPVGLDARKLSAGLTLRSWQAGDRFQPWGTQKAAKLKELLRQRRISVRERALWPVLESAGEIVWVRGFPPAASAVSEPNADEVISIVEEPCPSVRS